MGCPWVTSNEPAGDARERTAGSSEAQEALGTAVGFGGTPLPPGAPSDQGLQGSWRASLTQSFNLPSSGDPTRHPHTPRRHRQPHPDAHRA